MTTLKAETARVFLPLLQPARYKAARGGRGSGKSHFFAELLVEDSLREPGETGEGLRSVCIREVQKDLTQSAKLLIEDKLAKFGLGEADGFKVYNDVIRTPRDGIIIFKGMQDYTAESIKSLEKFKRAWTEEAQTMSERSLELLRPTIREPGSELWFSWNPRLEKDAVDYLCTKKPPTGIKMVTANWSDNPWFPGVLEQERRDCLRDNPDQYANIWGGDYVTIAKGAYYAKALSVARAQGRIASVSADPLMTMRAFWDIGGTGAKADAVSIIIAQYVAREIRVLDHYSAVGQPLATHINWLRRNGYEDALCVLPHDGKTNDKVYDVSYESALNDAGFDTEVIPNQGAGAAMMRVEAGRRLFPSIWFNDAKTEGLLKSLGWYHEQKDDKRDIGLGPAHDWCLATGTQVLTPLGWRSVEDIAVHDEVLTPCGTRRILRSGIVRETNEWTTVKGIRCTPEHRFFTSRGLVEAGTLLPGERFWTRGDLGLTILASLSAAFRFGLKTAITLATQEARGKPIVARSSFTAWSMRMCMAKYRQTMKSITSMMTRLIVTLTTSKLSPGLSIAATTNRSRDINAFVGFAARNSAATSNSGRDAAPSASASIMPVTSENAALSPAYNLTVDVDECYFVRGDDGRAYLVSNSSHDADAFGLMCVAYEIPRAKGMVLPQIDNDWVR